MPKIAFAIGQKRSFNPMSFSVEEKCTIAAAALDDLVKVVAACGFGYRTEAEDSVAATRAKMFGLAVCTALVALILVSFAYSLSKPSSPQCRSRGGWRKESSEIR